MNHYLEGYARSWLIEKIGYLTEEQKLVFNKMYSPENSERSIIDTIKNMSSDKLDWAMTQIENTLRKRANEQSTEKDS